MACDFFPGGAHIETVRVGCCSAIHVISARGAVSSWCSWLLHAISDLFYASSSMRFPLVVHALVGKPACVALVFAPLVPVSAHRRPRIGELATAALELVSNQRLQWSCRQLHRTCQRISLLPAHRQLSRRTPWAHRAVAIIHVDFSGGRHRPSAVAGCVKLVSTTGWTGSASAFPTIAALA